MHTCYREWLTVKSGGQGRHGENSKRWCRKRGLEEQRFYEMTKLRQQFKDILNQSGLLKESNEEGLEAMSSAERTARHGELKKLRHLKKEYHLAESSKKKKFLSTK